MPGLPLVARETTNPGCNCSHSRPVDQMCRQDSRVHLSAEEAIAAEESLSIYCKPVELYNILQRRALRNPSFLQRCLHYKIQAKRKRRIQMTVSLSGAVNDGVQAHNLLPLYIILARPISDIAAAGNSAVFCLARTCLIVASSEFEGRSQTEANFVLPEIHRLSANEKASILTVLLVSCGEANNSLPGSAMAKDHLDMTSFSSSIKGPCLWGKIPLESLYSSWLKCMNLNMGQRAEMLSAVDMHSGFVEPSCLDEGSCISFKVPQNSGTMSSLRQVQVNISAQEVGAKERSPYSSYMCSDVPGSSLSHLIRLRSGNVIFNYRYYNNMLQKTEVTEDFSCPFCLVQCASFKGLRYHLCSSHDLFNFEFWVTEEYQAVNVFVKTDIWRSEIVADGIDPRLQTFFFCSKPRKRKRSKSLAQNAKHVHPQVVKLDLPEVMGEGLCGGHVEKNAGTSSTVPVKVNPTTAEPSNQISHQKAKNDAHTIKGGEKTPKILSENGFQNESHKAESNGFGDPCTAEYAERVASSPNVTGVSTATAQSSAGLECLQPISGSNLAPPAMLQFAKMRKLSAERSDPRNRTLLQKRQFFHSHRAQPMALEQVLSDRDSEDEVDDDIADFEDRRMLDDFVDVTKDEKQIMHLWNSFVRKQRVLADGHIPWACEAFSRLHGRDLVRAPNLIWCWRLFMIKLWNHSLLDARTMNNCNIVLERYQSEGPDPKQS
ncbi:PREDICTED: polycomb group protein EMBRYONIC FLOWER 2 isoform X2 [Nelumbo nucifera]|uniref:Polycomb group protein EMBRYONIC FLOWER 2 isoform X2 n=1 Tax=Nelumbo nucifera TaxID=4432 RepID=A0A1U8BFA1_NELNU|nr:PREDICTED: polycomb group protein EMBRYONIC FLOWER 2 isoform X2 [Nelumbo nucifera]